MINRALQSSSLLFSVFELLRLLTLAVSLAIYNYIYNYQTRFAFFIQSLQEHYIRILPSSAAFLEVDHLIVDAYFVVAIRGLFSYDPAQSCKEIKDLSASIGDGEYCTVPQMIPNRK